MENYGSIDKKHKKKLNKNVELSKYIFKNEIYV